LYYIPIIKVKKRLFFERPNRKSGTFPGGFAVVLCVFSEYNQTNRQGFDGDFRNIRRRLDDAKDCDSIDGVLHAFFGIRLWR
jgi:hypothetical protein